MKTVTNVPHTEPTDEAEALLLETEARHAALRHIIDAWDEALLSGVKPEQMASAMLYAAITEMVGAHGEEKVADMIASLPERIRCGEYTLYEPRQKH